jgi:hypothetical protein
MTPACAAASVTLVTVMSVGTWGRPEPVTRDATPAVSVGEADQ